MGIDKSLFKPHPELEQFICEICQNILSLDMQSCEYEHLFCQTCIEYHLRSNTSCPTCNAAFKKKAVGRRFKTMIERLDVNCTFCNTYQKYENLENHQKVCPERICNVTNGCAMKLYVDHKNIEGCVRNLIEKQKALENHKISDCNGVICKKVCQYKTIKKSRCGKCCAWSVLVVVVVFVLIAAVYQQRLIQIQENKKYSRY